MQLAKMLTGKPTGEQEEVGSFHPRKVSLALRFSLQNSPHVSAFSANTQSLVGACSSQVDGGGL